MYLHPDPGLAGFSLKKLVKKIVKPIAHIGAAVMTGGASLAVSAAMVQKDAQKKAIAAQQKGIAASTAEAMGETQPNFDPARYVAENYATANWGKGATGTKNRAKWEADPWGHWTKYGKKLGWAFPYKVAGTTLSPVAPVTSVATVAPSAAAVAQAVQTAPAAIPMPSYVPQITPTTFAPSMPQFAPETQFEPLPAEVSQAKLPPWAIPAGLGLLAVVGVVAMKGRGRGRR